MWDALASTPDSARYFCDGSADERELRQRGEDLARRIRLTLDIRPNHLVLEVGCGVARLGFAMAGHCAKWSGCDISPRMIALARRRTRTIHNIDFRLLEDCSLSCYDDRSFDRAYSIGVFCHLKKEDTFRYLCDVYRLLRPGGVFCCGMWNLCSKGGWKLWANHIRQSPSIPLHTWSTPQEMEALLAGAGFMVQALMTSSNYLVEAVVSRGPTRAHLAPSCLVDDKSLFIK
jgi:SAM-dependent methyltransferase